MKSFRPKDGSGEPPPAAGRNGERDFHGEKRKKRDACLDHRSRCPALPQGAGQGGQALLHGPCADGEPQRAGRRRGGDRAPRAMPSGWRRSTLIEPHAERPASITTHRVRPSQTGHGFAGAQSFGVAYVREVPAQSPARPAATCRLQPPSAPHLAQHVPDRSVAAVGFCQGADAIGAFAGARSISRSLRPGRSRSNCRSGLARIARRCPRGEALAAAMYRENITRTFGGQEANAVGT